MNFFAKTKPCILKDGSKLDPFIYQMLKRRGIASEAEIQAFLEPQLKDLPDPLLMMDMDKAATIVASCIIKGGSFLIWGDYDVDGTTATALLIRFLKTFDCKVDYYIPNRLTEGYGLQAESLTKLNSRSGNQHDVLITVDNGISAHEAVNRAKSLGYKVIVTDHHTPPETRVNADAILNPKQKECTFPGKNLSGVGVAFYLVIGARQYLQQNNYFTSHGHSPPNLKQFLDLVAIGTIADMVKLDQVNRILTRAGMEVLALQENLGVAELCRQSNIDVGMVCSEDISFQLAPKINAAGRLGCADKAVSLLVTDSKEDAVRLTAALTENNERRKCIALEDFINAKHEVSIADTTSKCSTIVTGRYHLGVAGIVASNFVERFNKPAIVLCVLEDGILKGSARSVKGVDLHKALTDCKTVLLGFGGHAMAAGVSLHVNDLDRFVTLFDEAVFRQNKGVVKNPEKFVEADIEIKNLFAPPLLRQLPLLEPYGVGNPQPIFRDVAARFAEATSIGKDNAHLRLSIILGETVVKGIGFGLGKFVRECRSGGAKTILYSPSYNFYNGRGSWQVLVHEIVNNHL